MMNIERTVVAVISPYDILVAELQQENADLRAKMEALEKDNKASNDYIGVMNPIIDKVVELESQVAVMRQGFETIKNNCEAGTDDYIWGIAHEILEGATTGASQKLQELEKFAELGRLALTTRGMVCGSNDFKKFPDRCENHCIDFSYCKLRAELLAGGRE